MIKDSSNISSLSSSTSSASTTFNNLVTSIQKSTEWLNELRELHYVPYNSCNSLTIYSYKYWQKNNRFLVATKANNLKEFFFKAVSFNDDLANFNSDSHLDVVLSNRSSLSSDASNPITTSISNKIEKSINSSQDKSLSELNYLDPVIKIHKFSKIKSEGLISTIEIIEVENFSVLVVCFALKNAEKFYIQLYSDFETSNLELILECCQEFEVDSMPHRASSIDLIKTNETTKELSTEKIIFINCSKRKNFFFLIDKKNNKFEKISKIENYLTEFKYENIPDNCTAHDIKYLDSNKSSGKNDSDYFVNTRLTAIGCQNGWLGIYLCDTNKNETLKFWEYENDSFITQLHFFTTKSFQCWSKIDINKTPVNLLVLRSLEPTRIMNNVISENNEDCDEFNSFQDLDIAQTYDLVTSAVIFDATFSGYNSIFLGTFGKTVLIFCPVPIEIQQEKNIFNYNNSSQIETDNLNSKLVDQKLHYFKYEIKRELLFKHSVMGLCKTTLSNNGSYDFVVLTLNGMSIWQYLPDKLIELLNQKYEENEQRFLDLINLKLSKMEKI